MVGAGTGIAPFRAFVETRQARGARGRNWLIFGDRHFRTDFLYQREWLDYRRQGFLQIDVAFSRDGATKDYVQHRLLDRSRALYAWLEEGAHFYVCGDASRMAPDVHEALIEAVRRESGRSREDAVAYVKELQVAGRYQRDVY
jgi:sulfite reductase (NADPH) flavoprotein alpha-component